MPIPNIRFWFSVAFAFLLLSPMARPAAAALDIPDEFLALMDIRMISNAQGPVFRIYFAGTDINGLDDDDDDDDDDDGDDIFVPFDLSEQQKQAIMRAAAYWVERVYPSGVPAELVNILVMPADNANASAASPEKYAVSPDGVHVGGAQQILTRGLPSGTNLDVAIMVGTLPFTYDPLTQLTSSWSLESVLIHEIGHALGITSAPLDESWRTLFETYLQGQQNRHAANYFDDPRVFTGPQAMAVYGDVGWGGTDLKPQPRPVPMSYEDDLGEAEAHFGIFNALMTHLFYRNYAGFMEVELAALNDVGYNIDLRNFFGRSVYVDGQTIVNNEGFFARNAEGTAYLPGQYNQAGFGLGLHIFANRTTLLQKADLLSLGLGGAGIRVDGYLNHITIAPGVRVHANGPLGTGLLVAHGHDNQIVQRGSVQALGLGGIAARFDLGSNPVGVPDTDRYSYFAQEPSYYSSLNPNEYDLQFSAAHMALNGPLVSRFDLSGELLGRQAAIYISPNAHVREINILNGAVLSGPIISDYGPYATRLTFGRAQRDGLALNGGDPNFNFYFRDAIQGRFVLETHGGYTHLASPRIGVESITVKENSALRLSGYGLVNTRRGLVNDGLLIPGDGVNQGTTIVRGGFTNNPTGEVLFSLNPGQSPSSDFIRVENGPAVLNGGRLTALARPHTGVYELSDRIYGLIGHDNMTINQMPELINGGSPFKPSLVYENGILGLTYREAYKYGEMGQTPNQRAVGRYMERIIGRSVDSGTELFNVASLLSLTTNPGSMPPTSAVLEQVSGSAYASLAGLTLRSAALSNSVLAGRLRQLDMPPAAAGEEAEPLSRFWSKAYGADGYFRTDDKVSGADYQSQSIMAGLDFSFSWADRFGFYLGYAQDKIDFRDTTAQAKTQNALMGLYWSGSNDWGYLQAIGGLGWGHYEMERALPYIQSQAEGKGQNFWGALYLEAGHEFALAPATKLKPFAGLQYISLRQDSADESQAEALSLAVDSLLADSLISSLGLDLNHKISFAQSSLNLNAHGLWQHEFLDEAQDLEAGLPRLSAAKFTVQGLETGSDWFLAGLSLDWQYGAWQIYLNYDCQFSPDQLIHLGQVGLAFSW